VATKISTAQQHWLLRPLRMTPLLAATSQALGLVQIALLLHGYSANSSSDVYFFLFAVGMFPIQTVISGVLYPRWLRRNSPKQEITAFDIGLAFGSAILVLAGAGYLSIIGRTPSTLFPIAAILAGNTAISAIVWIFTMVKASTGNPRLNAAVALPANCGACVALMISWVEPLSLRTVAMCLGLLTGNIAMLVLLQLKTRFRWVIKVRRSHSEPDAGRRPESRDAALVGKSFAGYGAGMALQMCVATLPPSSLTLFNVASRCVASVVGSGVNTVLPRLVHIRSEAPTEIIRLIRLVLLSGFVLMLFSPMAFFFRGSAQTIVIGVVAVAWTCSAAVNASAQRAAYRYLGTSSLWVTAGVALTLGLSAVVLTLAGNAQLLTIFVLLVALEALPGAYLLHSFGWRMELMSFATVLSLAILVVGLALGARGGSWI
jgi:hypothetical protein